MRKVLALSAFLFVAGIVQAQDLYGHLNFGNLLSEMPESDAANSELEKLQASLVAEGEAQAKAFEEKYIAFVTAVQGGDLTPKVQAEQQAALEKEQQVIASLEQQLAAQIEQKRNELLRPIVERAQKAIDDVAKEKGYKLIFDTSIFGSVLFAEESVDVMPLVKAKLGM